MIEQQEQAESKMKAMEMKAMEMQAGTREKAMQAEPREETLRDSTFSQLGYVCDTASNTRDRLEDKLIPVLAQNEPVPDKSVTKDTSHYPPMWQQLKSMIDHISAQLESINDLISRTEL